MRRRLLSGAGLLLVAAMSVSCGGGPPTDASEDEFCDVYTDVGDMEDGKDAKEWGEKLEEVGTPKDIDDDERKGFELFVDEIGKIDEDAKPDEIDEPDLSDGEEKDFKAFNEYVSKNCAADMPTPEAPSEAPSELPSDLPSDVPSDLSSDLPSDLPSDLDELEEQLEELESMLPSDSPS